MTPRLRVDQPDKEIARAFSERDLISAAVVDDDGRLLGRITIDDVVDVIIEDAEEAVLGPAGLDVDEDTFAPVQSGSSSSDMAGYKPAHRVCCGCGD